jgi:hypothetical protein
MKDNNIIEHKNQYIKLLTNDTIKSKIKLIYSAYSIMKNGGSSYPDGKSDCKKCITEQCKKECTKSVPYQKAYKPLSTGYDSGNNSTNWKEGTYTRVHRNIDIVNAMREFMGLNIFENEDELFKYERLKWNCPEGCLICNEESKKLNMCIYCNMEKDYYPIFTGNYERYHECFHFSNKSIYEKYYFDEENKYFKSCYKTCKICKEEGNETNHNCLVCENNYIFQENSLYKNNCVLKKDCVYPYLYYFTEKFHLNLIIYNK